MKKAKVILYIMVFILLSGCALDSKKTNTPVVFSNAQDLNQTTVPSQKPTSISTPSKTILPFTATKSIATYTQRTIPTAIIASNTSTPSLTPKPTKTLASTQTLIPTFDPITKLKFLCLDKITKLPKDRKIAGKLILRSESLSYSLLNLVSYEQIPISTSGHVYNLIVSPNNEHMFYTECSGSSCIAVISSAEDTVVTIPYKREWRAIRWLDNERLAMIHDGEPYNSAIIVNPFRNEEMEIILDMPNPYYFHTLDNTQILLNAIDPTLTRVVYFDNEGIGRIILWDVTTGKILGWLPYFVPNDPSAPPPGIDYLYGWSPDGNQFITTSPVTFTDESKSTSEVDELFSINRDGEVTQITHFGAVYKFVRISGFRWSPDGKYIGFWYETGNNAEQPTTSIQRFAILEITTQEVTDYCLPFGSPEYSSAITPPVWAPDSQQLVIENLYEEKDNRYMILVDIVGLWAVKIAENVTPVGWMVDP